MHIRYYTFEIVICYFFFLINIIVIHSLA